mgnify:CR=1 FL=1
MDNIYGDFWETFLEETNTPETTVLTGCTYFGASEEESVQALEQLLRGDKTAVGHCVTAYVTLRQRMPRIGDYTMVADFYGNPCCILKTVDVTIVPLTGTPEDLRRQEYPELDADAWLDRKQQEFRDLARQHGFRYHPELPILMETVQRVYPVRKQEAI